MNRNSPVSSVSASLVDVPLDGPMSAYGSSILHVVLVRITDADGRSGTGFTYTLTDGAAVVPVMVDVLAPLVIGTSPDAWDVTYASLWQRTRRLGRTVFAPAISALDIAAWDLRSTRAGVPLFESLGRRNTPIPMYGSGRSGNSLTTEQLVDGAAWYADRGFTAMKIRVGAHEVAHDVGRVAAVREAVGSRIELMVDANERLDLSRAVQLCEGLAELAVSWIEEPFATDDVDSHAELAGRTTLGIATGEHLVTPQEFARVITDGAVDIVQPDAALCGGITQALRIAEAARTVGAAVSFHALPELHVHLAAGDDNVLFVEHFPLLQPLITEPLLPRDGAVRAPTRPGLGIGWDAEAVERHTVSTRQVGEPTN